MNKEIKKKNKIQHNNEPVFASFATKKKKRFSIILKQMKKDYLMLSSKKMKKNMA